MKEKIPMLIANSLVKICDLIRKHDIKFSMVEKEVIRRNLDMLSTVVRGR